jgi:hypothetical protein
VAQAAPVATAGETIGPMVALESAPRAMRAMKLLKNYAPVGDIVMGQNGKPIRDKRNDVTSIPNHEIVGWHRPEIKHKDSHGIETIVQTAEFIRGEGAPPPFAGVGFANKIWAGTVIKVPVEEARNMQALKIAERDVEDD